MQARYYDPVIGRFYSNDPVGTLEHFGGAGGIHGFNRYAYANNNPYKYIDPDGRKVEAVARPLKTPILGGAGVHTYTKVTQSDGTETIFSSHKVDGNNQVSKNHSSDQANHMFIGKTTISPPEGMTQEQFDQAVLEQGQSLIESDSLEYSAFPGDQGEGNCNTTTRNLINGAGSKIKLLIFEVIILVGVFYYLQLLADTIAKYTGYPLATYGVPAAICSLFSFLLGKVLKMKGKPLTNLRSA